MSSREEGYKCAKCGKVYAHRVDVHSQADNSKKGYRLICCKCLGHEPLSCLDKYSHF